jgi:hypothetical protein
MHEGNDPADTCLQRRILSAVAVRFGIGSDFFLNLFLCILGCKSLLPPFASLDPLSLLLGSRNTYPVLSLHPFRLPFARTQLVGCASQMSLSRVKKGRLLSSSTRSSGHLFHPYLFSPSSYIQNIRNNSNKRRSPKWAVKYGLIDPTDDLRKKAKSQWAGRCVPVALFPCLERLLIPHLCCCS